jgi:hypothetical protein
MEGWTMARKNGLDFDPSNVGLQADAYNVAWTALKLAESDSPGGERFQSWHTGAPARHAVALHVISGKLHRLDERRCSEPMDEAAAERREASLMADAQEIAAHYGMNAYHQGDCRGCALYLVEPAGLENKARSYTDGHAVVRLGR